MNKLDHSPLVSVIIPAYNAEKFIEKTLKSVLCQTYKNIEVLVVDDGSQDRTAEIVELFAQKDSRVILLRQTNSGVAAARNLAIEKSTGELIAPIDADDLWDPQNLEKQVRCMLQADATVGLVYAWSIDIDETDALSGGFHVSRHEGNVYLKLLYQNFIGNASSVLIRRSCLQAVGGYNCQLRQQNAQGCEDIDLYLRIAEHYQFRVVPEFLIGYRQVTSSMSRDYTAMVKSHQLVLKNALKKHPEIPAAIYFWSLSDFYIYLAHQSTRNRNAKTAFIWLYKALSLDPTMALIRHDCHFLLLDNLFKNISQNFNSLITPKHLRSPPHCPSKTITMSDINRLMMIRQRLPSKIYEKIRFQWLFLKIGLMNLGG